MTDRPPVYDCKSFSIPALAPVFRSVMRCICRNPRKLAASRVFCFSRAVFRAHRAAQRLPSASGPSIGTRKHGGRPCPRASFRAGLAEACWSHCCRSCWADATCSVSRPCLTGPGRMRPTRSRTTFRTAPSDRFDHPAPMYAPRAQPCSQNCRIASATARGASRCGKCPTPSSTARS